MHQGRCVPDGIHLGFNAFQHVTKGKKKRRLSNFTSFWNMALNIDLEFFKPVPAWVGSKWLSKNEGCLIQNVLFCYFSSGMFFPCSIGEMRTLPRHFIDCAYGDKESVKIRRYAYGDKEN